MLTQVICSSMIVFINKIYGAFMDIKESKNNGKKRYVTRDDVLKLLMNHIGDYSTADLGWWLETKTANNFTVIELEFITQAFATLRSITSSVALFEKEWTTKVGTSKG